MSVPTKEKLWHLFELVLSSDKVTGFRVHEFDNGVDIDLLKSDGYWMSCGTIDECLAYLDPPKMPVYIELLSLLRDMKNDNIVIFPSVYRDRIEDIVSRQEQAYKVACNPNKFYR